MASLSIRYATTPPFANRDAIPELFSYYKTGTIPKKILSRIETLVSGMASLSIRYATAPPAS
nr:hypothetical protein [Bacteroidota bacterium]